MPTLPYSDRLAVLESAFEGRKREALVRHVHAGGGALASPRMSRSLMLSAAEHTRFDTWCRDGLSTTVHSIHTDADGTERLVLATCDGRTLETVAMARGTVCVSSQIGCAVGCGFCASGLRGLERNLEPGEIVEQLVHARRRMPIRRVVYMGMGEPTHNLDAVLEAVARIATNAGISPSHQMLSTVGSIEAIERIRSARVRPGLALSLHSTDDVLRRRLLVRAPRDDLKDLVDAVDAYAREVKLPAQFEWTLLRDVNDGDDEAERAAELLSGRFACVNLIVWNAVEGLPFERTEPERVLAFLSRLRSRGIVATVRHSAGQSADAACGQLRRRVMT